MSVVVALFDIHLDHRARHHADRGCDSCFQLLVLRRPIANWQRVAAGFVCVILGLAMFLVGLDLALFPLGKPWRMQLAAADFLDPGRNACEEMASGPSVVSAITGPTCLPLPSVSVRPLRSLLCWLWRSRLTRCPAEPFRSWLVANGRRAGSGVRSHTGHVPHCRRDSAALVYSGRLCDRDCSDLLRAETDCSAGV
jgi:hypothetical protein